MTSTKDTTYLAAKVKTYIQMIAAAQRQSGNGSGTHCLILEHGREFLPAKHPEGFGYAEPKQCYTNAVAMAIPGYLKLDATGEPPWYRTVVEYIKDRFVYCEGVAIPSVNGLIPVDHAWVWDRSTGKLYDPTPVRGGWGSYFGIPFRTEYVARLWQDKTKTNAPVIDNWEQRWPLLKMTPSEFAAVIHPLTRLTRDRD